MQKIKLVAFHYHLADSKSAPVLMNGQLLVDAYWFYKSLPTSNGTHIFVPCFIFKRVRSDHEWSIVSISGMVLSNLHPPASTEFKSGLVSDDYYPLGKPYPTHETLVASNYSIANYYGRCSDEFHQSRPSQLGPDMPFSR